MEEKKEEKLKRLFKKKASFEQRVSLFFCICFAILTIQALYMNFIRQDIKSLYLNVKEGSAYSYQANNNAKAASASVAGLYSYIDDAIKKEASILTNVIVQEKGTTGSGFIKIIPATITEDMEVSVIFDDKAVKAMPTEDGYFTIDCENIPDYFVVKLETREGTKTEKILLEDVEYDRLNS